MANNVRVIATDAEFDPELTNAGNKLVVVDYYATWCGPCNRIAPLFVQLSAKYPKAVFLKVDVDQCQGTAQAQGVSAMPTFIFYKNKVKIDSQRGADPNSLEEKIKKWYGGEGEEDGGDEVMVKGHMDLSTFINKSGCECLNEADDHPLAHCLSSKGGYLESDCDEQLLISIEFSQPVKLHSLKLYGPEDKGPKTVKVFQNQPRSLDFDSADSMEPTQTLELTTEDIKEGNLATLRYVKFQNVTSVTLFVRDNQGGGEVTQLDHLGFIGSPVNATNMSEFKRVAGKKGESH
ncbi:thioredoxin-like protein 1 [Mya arenaria]|uniref:thioredoxin-like protein 1 n=1 Tax=Mya arenaria TaxID=6604 RepID=UPI0022E424AA|nr:thioredoxin-like protein 1 [Mya arenaria]